MPQNKLSEIIQSCISSVCNSELQTLCLLICQKIDLIIRLDLLLFLCNIFFRVFFFQASGLTIESGWKSGRTRKSLWAPHLCQSRQQAVPDPQEGQTNGQRTILFLSWHQSLPVLKVTSSKILWVVGWLALLPFEFIIVLAKFIWYYNFMIVLENPDYYNIMQCIESINIRAIAIFQKICGVFRLFGLHK